MIITPKSTRLGIEPLLYRILGIPLDHDTIYSWIPDDIDTRERENIIRQVDCSAYLLKRNSAKASNGIV